MISGLLISDPFDFGSFLFRIPCFRVSFRAPVAPTPGLSSLNFFLLGLRFPAGADAVVGAAGTTKRCGHEQCTGFSCPHLFMVPRSRHRRRRRRRRRDLHGRRLLARLDFGPALEARFPRRAWPLAGRRPGRPGLCRHSPLWSAI